MAWFFLGVCGLNLAVGFGLAVWRHARWANTPAGADGGGASRARGPYPAEPAAPEGAEDAAAPGEASGDSG